MIIAKSCDTDYKTSLSDGEHEIFADTPVRDGGKDEYMRPGTIFASGLAACINITTRKLLNEEGIAFTDVTTYIDLDRSNPEKLTFRKKTVIEADISDEKKAEILARVERCPVCKMMTMPKEFLEME